jgi:hypothetical protein
MKEPSVPTWVIWALGVTQMTGYGTLYYSFSGLAPAFAALFGFGSGLTSIVGGTLPLALFGQAGYGSRSGWINSVRLVSSAIAPFIFPLLQESLGVHAAIWIIAGFGGPGIAAFVAMAAMAGAGRTAPA